MPQLQKDVYRGFKFSVTIDGFKRASFQKVTGLKSAIEVVEYREGNMPDRMEKLPGMMSFDAVTLERGISFDDDFNEWIQEVTSVVGNATDPVTRSTTKNDQGSGEATYRRDVFIALHDKKGEVVKEYELLGAWCSEYTIGDFDATSQDVVISSLVIQHHGIVEKNTVS